MPWEPIKDNGKPWCCYCSAGGDGRIVFLNDKGTIIDNPFCSKHMQVVCKHTIRKLKKRAVKFNAEPKFVIESWPGGYWHRKNLPTQGQFYAEFYKSAAKYTRMVDENEFTY